MKKMMILVMISLLCLSMVSAEIIEAKPSFWDYITQFEFSSIGKGCTKLSTSPESVSCSASQVITLGKSGATVYIKTMPCGDGYAAICYTDVSSQCEAYPDLVKTCTTTQIKCPSNSCDSWRVIKTISGGTVLERQCLSYGSAPTCQKNINLDYQTKCSSGYHISGKDGVSTDNRQTTCSKDAVVEPPVVEDTTEPTVPPPAPNPGNNTSEPSIPGDSDEIGFWSGLWVRIVAAFYYLFG
jgi:hypothetical protein